MKPAPFEYQRAHSIEHALGLLAEHGPEAKLIAGGQSLTPMMAMRLVRPTWLIDIAGIDALSHVTITDHDVRVGGATPQYVLAEHAELGQCLPIIGQALAWVGHIQTRNRGTLGGSLVHADPSAELPLVSVLLDARLILQSGRAGRRELPAREFFNGPMSTVIEPDECLIEIVLPRWRASRCGSAFDEVAIRHGDFALVSACAQMALDAEGRCQQAALALGGADNIPLDYSAEVTALIGRVPTEEAIDRIARSVVARLSPPTDLHASADYRRALARTLCVRVLRSALARAGERTGTPAGQMA